MMLRRWFGNVPAGVFGRRLSSSERVWDTVVQSEVANRRFRVALVGRTNVGKSTLFNRLSRQSRAAIVHNVPGTTRDRRYAKGMLAGIEFDLIDTGGLEDAPNGSLEEGMLQQTKKAIHEADLVYFVIDGREGITPVDRHFAKWLRREDISAPINLVANKVEGYPDKWDENVDECYRLGFGPATPISAEHAEGIPLLLDVLIPEYDKYIAKNPQLQEEQGGKQKSSEAVVRNDSDMDEDSLEESEDKDDPRTIKLAIVGRPNVGKSTLLNKIVRHNRVLTGPTPGVTRDSVEVGWKFEGRDIVLVDTAGIRKYSKRDHENKIENLSVEESYRALGTAQVVLVVVDMTERDLIHMDLKIADRVIEEGRALIIVANKSDSVDSTSAAIRHIRDQLDNSLAQVRGVPVISVSALKGSGVKKLLPEIVKSHGKWDTRVSTGKLNRWLKAVERHHPPPTINGKSLKVKYMTQVKARPPTFAMFINKDTSKVPESYQRFMLNQLREEFGMTGVPSRLLLRSSSDNRYFTKSQKKHHNKAGSSKKMNRKRQAKKDSKKE